MNPSDSTGTSVPVTAGFLSLVTALQSSRAVFLSESALAEDLGLPAPQSSWERVQRYFSNDLTEPLRALGLTQNLITLEALLDLKISPEIMQTDFALLPQRYAFDPWLHQGRGGIYCIT